MAAPFETFGIEIALGSKGTDKLLQDIKHISEWGKKCGASTADIRKELDKFGDAIKNSGLSDAIKIFDRYKDALKLYEKEVDETSRKEEAAAKKRKELARQQKVQDFVSWARTGAATIGTFYAALQPVRRVFAFTDAIAKLNFQMRMLHFSSSIGIESLAQFGAIASMNGGSAKTVAAFSEHFSTQIENAKRGGGLGFLAENYRKYGLTFNEHETGEQYFERALQRYRNIDKRLRPMFAQEVGRERASEMIFRGSLSAKEDSDLRAVLARIASAKDVDGSSRKENASTNAKNLTIATKTLEASWNAIKDQVLNALYPTIISITKTIQKWTDYLNKHPEIINRVAKIVAGIAALLTTIFVGKAIVGLLRWVNIFGTIKGLASGIVKILDFKNSVSIFSKFKLIPIMFSRAGKNLIQAAMIFLRNMKLAFAIMNTGIGRAGKLLMSLPGKFGVAMRIATVAALAVAIAWAYSQWKKYFEKRKELQEVNKKVEEGRERGAKIKEKLDTQFAYAVQFKQMQSMIANGASASALEGIKKSVAEKEAKLKGWGMNTQNIVEMAEESAESAGVDLNTYKYNNSRSSVDNSRNQQNNYFVSEGGQKDAETASRAMAGIHNGDSNVIVSTSERT